MEQTSEVELLNFLKSHNQNIFEIDKSDQTLFCKGVELNIQNISQVLSYSKENSQPKILHLVDRRKIENQTTNRLFIYVLDIEQYSKKEKRARKPSINEFGQNCKKPKLQHFEIEYN